MAPSKKKKLSKREKKKMLSEMGKMSAERRGVGIGSRRNFVLAANWREASYKANDRKRGVRKRIAFLSPGKTRYWTQETVKKELVSRSLPDCLDEKPLSSVEASDSNSDTSEYCPSKDMSQDFAPLENYAEVERRLFVCESSQIMDLVEQVNATSKCSTSDCKGM